MSAHLPSNLRIDGDRLMDRLFRLGQVGALEGVVVCRLVLTDADKAGRNLVVGWMRDLGLEVSIAGISNHAGTTPMRLRHDAGYVAAAIATHASQIAREMGGDQVGTSGIIALEPNLINVIARRAKVTVDLRNTDEAMLQEAERRMSARVAELEREEGVKIAARTLARFRPVDFDPAMVERVAAVAEVLGHSVRRMPSGAGHDAQMFASNCPTAMIFVPSKGGISHNVREYTAPQEIAVGANVLLQVLLSVASE